MKRGYEVSKYASEGVSSQAAGEAHKWDIKKGQATNTTRKEAHNQNRTRMHNRNNNRNNQGC
jgi:hypothetical protein